MQVNFPEKLTLNINDNAKKKTFVFWLIICAMNENIILILILNLIIGKEKKPIKCSKILTIQLGPDLL